MKCKDCVHYGEISATKGTCFGVEIEGDRDPNNSEKCKGKYFKPRDNFTESKGD